MRSIFIVSGKVERFPEEGGWMFMRVPKRYTEETKHLAERGLVAVTATAGNKSWDTSLLPMGDGTHFIALPAKVRKKEQIALGETVRITFSLRER